MLGLACGPPSRWLRTTRQMAADHQADGWTSRGRWMRATWQNLMAANHQADGCGPQVENRWPTQTVVNRIQCRTVGVVHFRNNIGFSLGPSQKLCPLITNINTFMAWIIWRL